MLNIPFYWFKIREYHLGKAVSMNYYDLLGITNTAKDAEIKKAYHQMIIAFHPDKYQGDKQFAAKKSHEIIEAYDVLRNPVTRKKYDERIRLQSFTATEHKSKNTSTAPSRKHGKPSESLYSRFQNLNFTLKVALSAAGILFVIFVLVFFLGVLLYAARL
jgi:DnaJ-class molecular chaperone